MFTIPDPPRYSLARAPLVQALAQVRYPLIASLETMPGIAPVQEKLRDAFPYMNEEKTQEISLVMGPAGPASAGSASAVTWRLNDDEGSQLVIGAELATLSVGNEYTNVEDFEASFARLLEALKETVGVPRCDRVGVRYLSVAEDLPGTEIAWRDWFRSELTGWAGSDVVPAGTLTTSTMNTQLSRDPVGDFASFPSTVQANVRHGPIPEGTTIPGIPPIVVDRNSFFLDLDLFVTGPQPFDEEQILKEFRILHSEIDRFFFWTLTEEGKEHFEMLIRDE